MSDSGGKTRRILVVEDERAICEVFTIVLKSEGFEVDIAGNGKLAEEKIEEKDYDLAIVDIRTPIMNGKEFYQSIIDNKPEMSERIIFTTGDVMEGDTVNFIRQVNRPCLPKPFTPQELREMVWEVLKGIEK